MKKPLIDENCFLTCKNCFENSKTNLKIVSENRSINHFKN